MRYTHLWFNVELAWKPKQTLFGVLGEMAMNLMFIRAFQEALKYLESMTLDMSRVYLSSGRDSIVISKSLLFTDHMKMACITLRDLDLATIHQINLYHVYCLCRGAKISI